MNEDGFNDPVRVRNVPVAKVGERVHACTPRGVQRGVQKWLFVRVTCRIRNPKIVHPQFLPATKFGTRLPDPGALCYFAPVQ